MLARIKALQAGLILAGGLLVAHGASALELGEITLGSRLNEPLVASIALQDVADLDASQITIAAGTQEDYSRVNVERDQFIDSIRFTVELNGDGGQVLLTTTENVLEPFLNLIVTATWPNGRQLREFTLLVDLPTFSETPAAEPAPATTAAAGAVATAPATAATSDTYTINTGDTLWDIAQAMRPDDGVSVQQMMVAIQRVNADAFLNNNINRIISGRVLRIPTLQEIGTIDQDAAVAQVNQQNRELGGQPLAVSTGGGAGAAGAQDQLRVLTNDGAEVPAGGSSDLAATIAALENELMLSEENLDRARIENLELNNRLGSLQEQIDLLENIIAIEDERIAQLQAELASQTAATQQALAAAQSAAAAISDLDSQPQSGGLSGMLQNSLVLLGSLLGLVLVVLGFLVFKRRQAAAYADDMDYAAGEEVPADFAAGELESKPGFLANLLARFRRDEEDEYDEDDEEYEDEEDEPRPARPVTAVQPAVAVAAVAGKKNDTDKLLDEMGISDEMMNPDDTLERSASTYVEPEEFTPVDEADAEQTAASESSAVTMADNAFALSAADEALAAADNDTESAAVPDAIEFSSSAASLGAPATTAAAPSEEAEAFEFTLKEQPDAETATAASPKPEIETFDFKLATPASQDSKAASQDSKAASPAIETVSFPGTDPAQDKATAGPDDDLSLDLGDLTFDDTMVADAGEEDSAYKPRTGNECDTKLDLATAYEAMGDVAEAIEILDEVIAEGNAAQVETAQRLKQSWQSA